MGMVDDVQELIYQTEKLIHIINKDKFLCKEQRLKGILNITLNNLMNKRYTVSVIAAMKAGKSTTFNALLGRDILPNETDACTASITEIKHAETPSDYVLKIYNDGQKEKIYADNHGTLEQNFHLDVRKIRIKNEVAKVEKYYLENPIYALENSKYRDVVQNFVLVDTPGPNEASDGTLDVSELQKLSLEQLRNSDALIMLLDYQTYKSDTNATILKNIFENREDLKEDQEKIYFLINKIDVMTEKDGTVEEVIYKVKQLIRHYAPIISAPQVYAFSAKQACLARTVLTNNATEELIEEMRGYAHKYPEKVAINGKIKTLIPEPEEFADRLLHDSSILVIENNIVERMFNQSSVKLVKNAFERLNQVTTNIVNVTKAQLEISTQDADKLKKSVEDNKRIIDGLRSEGEILKEIPKQKLNDLKYKIKIIFKEIRQDVKRTIDNNMPESTILESADEDLLKKQAQSIQNNITQAVQLTINRNVDKIHRLAIDYQTQINQQLNCAFQDLSSRASEMIGKNMSLQFQTFDMSDIKTEFTKKNNVSIDIQEEEKGSDYNDDQDMIEDIIKGAGLGFGAGVVLPGLGNLAGAFMGAIGGFLKNMFSGRQVLSKYKVYRIDINPIKEGLQKQSNETVSKVVAELQGNFDNCQKRYFKFIENQLNAFIRNLKEQLDAILAEYDLNKDNIDKHVAHMESILSVIEDFNSQLEQIKTQNTSTDAQIILSKM